jgi:acyl carrier protein
MGVSVDGRLRYPPLRAFFNQVLTNEPGAPALGAGRVGCLIFGIAVVSSIHCALHSIQRSGPSSINQIAQKDTSMSEDLGAKVRAIIVDKLGVDEDSIADDSSFTNDLGADSLDTVELIMEFEKEFDLTIPDEDAEKIATVGDAISYLSEKSGA